MSILSIQLRKLYTFIYILIILLVFNLFFNLNYKWYGVPFIVRSYLFVFSFYLIFNYAGIKYDRLRERYIEKFGKKGEFFLFLELRVWPFLLIYFITVAFTLIDYLRGPNWPFNSFLTLLNGRYSNLVIYSLFLLLILKVKRNPAVTIPIFLFVCVLYFFIDKAVYLSFTGGFVIFLFKYLKLTLFAFFLSYEFFKIDGKKGFLKISAVSMLLGLLFHIIIFSFFFTVFKYSEFPAHQKKESGLILLKSGFSFPLDELNRYVIKTTDVKLFKRLFYYSKKYGIELRYTNREWEKLLFSGPVATADKISEYIMNKGIVLKYGMIVDFAEKKSIDPKENLSGADNFIKLVAGCIAGNESDFVNRISGANKEYKLWAMAVLGERKNISAIPFLLMYLTSMDRNISKSSYNALRVITGIDSAKILKKRINDPDVLIMFKEYYLHNRREN